MGDAILQILKLPLRYDPDGQWIVDAEGQPVLEVRGWGRLSSALGDDAAAAAQDDFGRCVAEIVNAAATRPTCPCGCGL